MPVARSTPEHKRRVRTGCLTCRRRRRKCDERKPQCKSCQEKKFQCRYPTLTFIPDPNATSLQGPADVRSSYRAITFVGDRAEVSTHPPPPPEAAYREAESQATAPQVDQNNNVQLELQNDVVEAFVNQVPLDVPAHPKVASASESEPLSRGQPQRQANWSSYFINNADKTAISNAETAMLLHFQYHIIPWVEVGNPSSTLVTDVMRLADENELFRMAIIALCSQHLERVKPEDIGDMDDLWRRSFYSDTHRKLQCDTTLRGRIGELVLDLAKVLTANPTSWRRVSMSVNYDWAVKLRFPGIEETLKGPMEDLLWFHLRVDLAGGLLNNGGPIGDLFYPVAAQQVTPSRPSDSVTQFLHCSLVYLSRCLSSDYHDEKTIVPHGSSWLSAWIDCQQWYQNRPPELHPIVEIRSLEAGQIDTESSSSLPITVFTSSAALLCNIIYHLTSRFLLRKRPRLLRFQPTQPRHLMSKNWHATQIAGIATHNDFPEQWDPIVIAGLHWIGEEMTDPSQQNALLECFRRITASMGIEMDEDTRMLQGLWEMYRGGGGGGEVPHELISDIRR